MNRNTVRMITGIVTILMLITAVLISVPYKVSANNVYLPIIIKNSPAKSIFRINGNELEELAFKPEGVKIYAVNYSKGRFKAISTTKVTLKSKKLSEEQIKKIKSSIANKSFDASDSTIDWDQAHTIEVKATQYFRYQRTGDLYLIHFDTTNAYIIYKDPQVYAQLYFISSSFGRKYRENYNGTFTYVTTGSFYEKGRTYYGISQGSSYSDYNGETLWTDCKPELSYEASQTHIDISATGSSWYMYIDFKFSGEEMEVITGP